MKNLAWSCRGMGDPQTIRMLQHLVRTNLPEVVFLRRQIFLNDLTQLVVSINEPWACIGDWNFITSNKDKKGGNPIEYYRLMHLKSVIDQCGLQDLGYRGRRYTWAGIRGGSLIEERLDRAYANTKWMILHEQVVLSHLLRARSDHSPVLLDTSNNLNWRPRPFRFEEIWNHHEDCKNVIVNSWKEDIVETPMKNLIRNVKNIGPTMRDWNKRVFGNVQNNVQKAKEELIRGQVDKRIANDPYKINELERNLEKALLIEEIHWKQKSGVNWLASGDKNTKFFHATTLQRRRRNYIHGFYDENRRWVRDNEEMSDKVFAFFNNLYSSEGCSKIDVVLENLSNNLSLEDNISLEKEVEEEEIIEAPISLCNTPYKIIAKILANKLKSVLNRIISPNQSAFIAGHQISDNVLLTHELIYTMKKSKSSKKFLAIKLDMKKAYDRVEMFRTATYRILVNGSPGQKITLSRGLRHGDPLSLFLFILISKALSASLNTKLREKKITGIKVNHYAPTITHLLFTDDSYVFSLAKLEEAKEILESLELYERVAGQKNTPERFQRLLAMVLGMRLTKNLGNYLGLPTEIQKSRSATSKFIIERVSHMIQGWKEKILTPTSKEVVLKSVASSLPIYSMSCFLLPRTVFKAISKLQRMFWWEWKIMCKNKGAGGLGFRDPHNFNKALLAKTAWRIITNPNSLLTRVLKAKYFLEVSFLNAKARRGCSLGWKNICMGKKILTKGVYWKVGNGNNIKIWLDPWIPSITGFKIPLNCPHNCNLEVVADLIDPNTKNWNPGIIRNLFPPPIAEAILKIYILPRTIRIEFVAYWVANSAMDPNSEENPNNLVGGNSIWRLLWSLKLLPKIKSVWRALPNGLPVKELLANRIPALSSTCPVCQESSESIEHVLLYCQSGFPQI
uniref:Reverse transcriptase domain-containing protein n=1 Tax=Nelumbo nucifera TaxID=4432 RepID=A0A822Z4K3_NELNU|nr:TPA_asm: hypothetical protein HUJ06_015587 [Nelumbo nucifera]